MFTFNSIIKSLTHLPFDFSSFLEGFIINFLHLCQTKTSHVKYSRKYDSYACVVCDVTVRVCFQGTDHLVDGHKSISLVSDLCHSLYASHIIPMQCFFTDGICKLEIGGSWTKILYSIV